MAGRGQVVETLAGGYAKIRMERADACASCGACGLSCESMSIVALNPDGAEVGDWVEIGLEPKYFLSAATILYGLPLTAMLAGSAAGYYGACLLGINAVAPIAGLAFGAALTGVAYFLIKSLDKKLNKTLYTPTARM